MEIFDEASTQFCDYKPLAFIVENELVTVFYRKICPFMVEFWYLTVEFWNPIILNYKNKRFLSQNWAAASTKNSTNDKQINLCNKQ